MGGVHLQRLARQPVMFLFLIYIALALVHTPLAFASRTSSLSARQAASLPARGIRSAMRRSSVACCEPNRRLPYAGYWELHSNDVVAYGGPPVLELREDGTGKMPSRYGKVVSWQVESTSDGKQQMTINMVDTLAAPLELRGEIAKSEYFPYVVDDGEVRRRVRGGKKPSEQTAEFRLVKIE